MSHTEKVVHDLESTGPRGVVHSCNICHHGVFGGSMVFEERDDGNDTRGRNIDRELIFPD